ncbi:hypothetical protein TCAL_01634 [Tigriopus californicus]|uniref:Uncharacterized protein n=1 Tax=Tigriopus californicus TaxID=6832 RepID=A0A553PDE3_TIGCA|nr:hypothetical protein TCAL_01634 [Tigriopus californicus]
MLFRTLEEAQIILDEAQVDSWYHSLQSWGSRGRRANFQKMTLFIHDGVRKASSNSAQRFALASMVSRAELKYNFQVFTGSKPEDELHKSANFVHCYIKALLKKRENTDNAWSTACRSVRVDPNTKCGLRKLWMSQVMQICPPRAKQAIHELEDPCQLRKKNKETTQSEL